jgi:formamidopyrimidine-DNA glycosylase
MPELPEVETIARRLRNGSPETPALLNRRIESAELLWERTLAEPSPQELQSRIIGQTIIDIGRRAKYLLIHLNQETLVIHLRMSGDLLVEETSDPVAPHHRFLINFDDGIRLSFNDVRKFGRVWLMEDPASLFVDLGPEPLENSFTTEILQARLKTRRRQLKPLLLDQSFIAGIGNIYADEALHKAKLHPQTLAASVSPEQAISLWQSIRDVLNLGIQRNGASIDWVYRGGGFQNEFQVYQRTDEPCYQCQTPIERITVGQRSTHFCPSCQPLPDDE